MAEIRLKESPFTPGRPVQPEYFVARVKEIQRLERAVKQTASGRNENAFIIGQRGIGKSSLAGFIQYLAIKEYDFIGSHCCLGGTRSLEGAMGLVFERLLKDCTDKSLFDKLREIFRNYIEGATLFGIGVQFTKDKTKLTALVDNFLPILRKVYSEAEQKGKQGLVLILDDLNRISDVPQFSQFLKSFVDTLALSRDPLPLFLILVGLPERREDLIKHQPSVGRIFDVIELPVMSDSETEDFFMHMFESINVSIDSNALNLMVALSGGLPMIMHEIGDAVFWKDEDKYINVNDALNGTIEAAQVVGRKYIDPKVSKLLRSKTYTSILRNIYKKAPMGGTFNRQQILESLPSNEKNNFDNFLKRGRKLGIIRMMDARGEYKFVNPLHKLYAWSEAKNKGG